MSAAMTPAGWIGGDDLIYRTANALHVLNAASGREPVDPMTAASGGEVVLAMALSSPTPSLAAFVRQNGEWFTIPPTLWALAVDAHVAGKKPSPLSLAFLSPTLPPVFGAYAGQVALYGAENVKDFLARVAASTAPVPSAIGDDPERPWRSYGSVKRWVMHPVAATRFADTLLAGAGVHGPTEQERRVVLDRHLSQHGHPLGVDTIGTYRRAGKHTVR